MNEVFYIDNLSLILIALVSFIGVTVAFFSKRYLKGDRKIISFYRNLAVMIFSVCIMVSANHLALFLIAWAVSNFFLTRLMCHKKNWFAARYASYLAFKNFALGQIFLLLGFLGLYYVSGATEIQAILRMQHSSIGMTFSLLCLILAALTQSALWPFHRWIISSLNSPTPVSAIMHAGLINGGGVLLTRFAPLFFQNTILLKVVFVVGLLSAFLGILWKLVQNDIKRMLACSTLGQMGFMFVQCGLGLFPAAIAHLCWHGLFKAYLFLASGSTPHGQRFSLQGSPKIIDLGLALLCGIGGAGAFSFFSAESLSPLDTDFFLIFIAFIAGTQVSLTVLSNSCSIMKGPLAFLFTVVAGSLYGLSVYSITNLLIPLGFPEAQPLEALHVAGLALLTLLWAGFLFRHTFWGSGHSPTWALKAYVRVLNASQPHPKTITTHRNHYKF
jgi:NAD(P)H-quinone oxidoreductase subunit 5